MIWTSNPTPGYVSEKIKTLIRKDMYTPTFISSTIYNQPRHISNLDIGINVWMDKDVRYCIHTQSAIKKEYVICIICNIARI